MYVSTKWDVSTYCELTVSGRRVLGEVLQALQVGSVRGPLPVGVPAPGFYAGMGRRMPQKMPQRGATLFCAKNS